MHTGMSPPPTLPTRCRPIRQARAATAKRSSTPKTPSPDARKAPMSATKSSRPPRFRKFLPGRFSGLDERFPFSFPKAMMLPVSVTPPTKSPSTAEMFSMVAPATGVAQKEPMEVTMAAKPTSEWKAATVCGSAMGLTLPPMTTPSTPPAARSTPESHRSVESRSTSVATRAPATPSMPNLHPALAVDMAARPPMAATHSSAETVLMALRSSGRVSPTARKTRPGRSIMGVKSFSPGFLKRFSIRCETTKPPKMFTAETAIAAMARPRAAGTCVRDMSRMPPTAVMPEMALVTDMSGVCRECATPQTAW
mmetsp:Transcript_107460/g.336647  ORF Transcript_107460/g.336647 Transcript_107460/m.336647 type:complete len:309 (-) Transcript_107460:1500-2426(-)